MTKKQRHIPALYDFPIKLEIPCDKFPNILFELEYRGFIMYNFSKVFLCRKTGLYR